MNAIPLNAKHFISFASLILFLALTFACSKPEPPVFNGFTDVKLSDVTSESVLLKTEAILYNPNAFGAKVSGIDLDIFIEGKEAGNVKETDMVNIPANGTFKVPVIANIPFFVLQSDLLNTAMSIFGNKKMKIRYKGYITLNMMDVDVPIYLDAEKEVETKGLNLKNFDFGKLNLGKRK